MENQEKNQQEKKISRSNTRKTYKSKIKNLGYSLALVTVIGLTGCGSKDLEVKQAAENYQDAVENVEDAKEKIKDKEIALEKAEKDLQKAKKEFEDAQKKEAEAKKDLKKESSNL